MKTNEQLYKDIAAKLEFEPGLNAKNIIVGVKDGIVTLTGKVHSWEEVKQATRAA